MDEFVCCRFNIYLFENSVSIDDECRVVECSYCALQQVLLSEFDQWNISLLLDNDWMRYFKLIM